MHHRSQTKKRDVYFMRKISVAFSGSGFLFPIHIGAVCALHDNGFDIAEVSGTSGGSLVAAAVACGIEDSALKSMAIDLDLRPFLRPSPVSILKLRGYCNGNNMSEWLGETFNYATFNKTKIPLTIVASDVENMKDFVFSSETTPFTQVSVACRASAAVPMVYTPVLFDNKLLFDGGMVNNIPLSKLSGKFPMLGIDVNYPASSYHGKGLISLGKVMLQTMLSSNEDTQELLGEKLGAKILMADAGDAGFLDTSLPKEEREKLFNSGYNAVQTWLGKSLLS